MKNRPWKISKKRYFSILFSKSKLFGYKNRRRSMNSERRKNHIIIK